MWVINLEHPSISNFDLKFKHLLVRALPWQSYAMFQVLSHIHFFVFFFSLVTPYSVLELEVNNKFSLKSDVPLGCARIELNDVLHSSHGKCMSCHCQVAPYSFISDCMLLMQASVICVCELT